MATPSKNYVFDQWAEFLTVTICENISRCLLGQSKVKKVRLTLSEQSNWPVKFKVILDNELMSAQKLWELKRELQLTDEDDSPPPSPPEEEPEEELEEHQEGGS